MGGLRRKVIGVVRLLSPLPSGSDARVMTEDHWKVTADDARRQDNRDKTMETTMRKHNIPDIG